MKTVTWWVLVSVSVFNCGLGLFLELAGHPDSSLLTHGLLFGILAILLDRT